MKKKLFKSIFLIVLILTSFVTIRAEVASCSPTNKITIKSDGNKPTGWSAKLPVCRYEGPVGYTTYGKNGSITSFKGAENFRDEQIRVTSETADAKGVVNSTIPRCVKNGTKFKVVRTCTATAQPNTCERTKKGCEPTGDDDCIEKYPCCPVLNNVSGTLAGNTCNYSTSKSFYISGGEPGGENTKWYDNKGNVSNSNAYDSFKDEYSSWSCSNSYLVECPNYICRRSEPVLQTCVPTYKLPDGSPAYCVNPSLGFNSEYQIDDRFNVNECKKLMKL